MAKKKSAPDTKNLGAADPPLELRPETAWDIYKKLNPPSVKQTGRILREAGHKVSDATLYKWRKQHKWDALLAAENCTASIGAKDFQAYMEALRIRAKEFGPDVLSGLQATIAEHMAKQVQLLVMATPEDFERMVTVMRDLDAEIHKLTGYKFSADVTNKPEEEDNVLRMRLGPDVGRSTN
ncbi:MAG: hypothetical protein GY952_14110 [Rhodobacteraceae bacterium]|nr:hypothetical protein [Paracoccaceae bacterium]